MDNGWLVKLKRMIRDHEGNRIAPWSMYVTGNRAALLPLGETVSERFDEGNTLLMFILQLEDQIIVSIDPQKLPYTLEEGLKLGKLEQDHGFEGSFDHAINTRVTQEWMASAMNFYGIEEYDCLSEQAKSFDSKIDYCRSRLKIKEEQQALESSLRKGKNISN